MRNLFLIICCIVFMAACSQKDNTTTAGTSVALPATKSIAVEPIEMYAGVDQLRVRNLPSLQSRVLVELLEGDTLYYLNAETIRKTTLTLRGKTYTAPWIKVRTKDDTEGWTYAGAVVNKK